MHYYRLQTSCLDRLCIACVKVTELETCQLLPLQTRSGSRTDRLPLPQHAIRRAGSQRCSAALFLHFRVAASMIYSIPNLHRIHPYEVLNLVIPYHVKFLLANGTWLIGKSWVRRYRDVLVLGVGGRERCSKCSSCGIR